MEKIKKIEELKVILKRLRKEKQRGQETGIEEKIADVEETLACHINHYQQ